MPPSPGSHGTFPHFQLVTLLPFPGSQNICPSLLVSWNSAFAYLCLRWACRHPLHRTEGPLHSTTVVLWLSEGCSFRLNSCSSARAGVWRDNILWMVEYLAGRDHAELTAREGRGSRWPDSHKPRGPARAHSHLWCTWLRKDPWSWGNLNTKIMKVNNQNYWKIAETQKSLLIIINA